MVHVAIRVQDLFDIPRHTSTLHWLDEAHADRVIANSLYLLLEVPLWKNNCSGWMDLRRRSQYQAKCMKYCSWHCVWGVTQTKSHTKAYRIRSCPPPSYSFWSSFRLISCRQPDLQHRYSAQNRHIHGTESSWQICWEWQCLCKKNLVRERMIHCSCDNTDVLETTLDGKNYEEADTRLILHAYEAADRRYERVLAICRDTDVLLLLVHFMSVVEVWMIAGTVMKRKCNPIQEVS